MVPRWLAIADLDKQNRLYNQRLCHGYNAMSLAAGFDPVDCEETAEEPTKIDVRGDDHSRHEVHHHYEKSEHEEKTKAGSSWPLALGGVAAGLGTAALAWSLYSNRPPPATTDDPRARIDFGVEVEPGGALSGGQNDDRNSNGS